MSPILVSPSGHEMRLGLSSVPALAQIEAIELRCSQWVRQARSLQGSACRAGFKPPERVGHRIDEHLTVHIDLSWGSKTVNDAPSPPSPTRYLSLPSIRARGPEALVCRRDRLPGREATGAKEIEAPSGGGVASIGKTWQWLEGSLSWRPPWRTSPSRKSAISSPAWSWRFPNGE
jgi:hypothetical protein